jgi:uncharacterized surface protein with fasciclin (FAS1) repeats
MKTTTLRRTGGIAAVALTMSLSLAACSDDSGDDTTASDTASSAAPSEDASSAAPSEDASSDATDAGADTFGDGCAAVPTDSSDPGSFAGMVQDPVATAASNNPVLSTLVKAVTAADLGGTLNQAEALTVFAPSNDAFAAIPADTLNGLLADVPALTKVLTHHVVGERLDPTQVVGEQTTLNNDTVTVEGDTSGMTVDGANVICGNVQTANATVYIIDKVLV